MARRKPATFDWRELGQAKKMSGRKMGRWSMKSDRELILLAKSQTLEAIAEKIQRSPAFILKRAARLGLSIKRKAKGK
jgi:hypothetical protein